MDCFYNLQAINTLLGKRNFDIKEFENAVENICNVICEIKILGMQNKSESLKSNQIRLKILAQIQLKSNPVQFFFELDSNFRFLI